LDDLYVRFFRLAERRIAEMTGKGVVCFISNFSYLRGPSFVTMREHLMKQFNSIYIDCMNGDSRETGKVTPDGEPDPSVFSTERNREGIRVGTCVSLLVRDPDRDTPAAVSYREFWGNTKKDDLLASLGGRPPEYESIAAARHNTYALRPQRSQDVNYLAWPTLVDLSAIRPFNGPIERRGQAMIAMKGEAHKISDLAHYLDPQNQDEGVALRAPLLMRSSGEFKAEKARRDILSRGVTFDESNLRRYQFKPMDMRQAYLDASLAPLFSRPSPELLRQDHGNNAFLVSRDTADTRNEGPPFHFSRALCDYDCISGHTRHFPVLLYPLWHTVPDSQVSFNLNEIDETPPAVNLSALARLYGELLGFAVRSKSEEFAWILWLHVLSTGFSPDYLLQNRDAVSLGWPRIPLPNSKELLEASAELGRKVADMLDPETEVAGVTTGGLRSELKVIGVPWRVDGGNLDSASGDLAVTAGWGHAGQGGVTMPGKGKSIFRPYSPEELMAIGQGAEALGLSADQALAQLGEQAVDVYLNDVAYWRCVPSGVWSYTIGGYQVMKKWLSYREKALLGRDLKPEEAREVRDMARRIAAILLLQPELDANYLAIKENTYEWRALT
jgi:hypothetical protein